MLALNRSQGCRPQGKISGQLAPPHSVFDTKPRAGGGVEGPHTEWTEAGDEGVRATCLSLSEPGPRAARGKKAAKGVDKGVDISKDMVGQECGWVRKWGRWEGMGSLDGRFFFL